MIIKKTLRSTARQSEVLSSYAGSCPTTTLPRITKSHVTFKRMRSSLCNRMLLLPNWDSVDSECLQTAFVANPRLTPFYSQRHQQHLSPQQPQFQPNQQTVFSKFSSIFKHLILLAVSVEMPTESQSVAHANYLLRTISLAFKSQNGHTGATVLTPWLPY